jgi:hypothetical protein
MGTKWGKSSESQGGQTRSTVWGPRKQGKPPVWKEQKGGDKKGK